MCSGCSDTATAPLRPITSGFGQRKVPAALQARLELYARGWLSTKIDEDGFRVLRQMTRANDQAGISRRQRWQGLIGSDLLQESNRAPILGTSADEHVVVGVSCPDRMFSASSNDKPTLPKEDFMSIVDDRGSYPSMSPAKFHGAALRWEAFLMSWGWPNMMASWCSILARPGWVITHKSWSRARLVLSSSPFYVIVWEISIVSAQRKLFSLLPESDFIQRHYYLVQVRDLSSDWRVLEVTGASPLQTHKSFEQGHFELCGKTGKSQSLLQAAAKSGFMGVTVPYLETLFKEMKRGGGGGGRPGRWTWSMR